MTRSCHARGTALLGILTAVAALGPAAPAGAQEVRDRYALLVGVRQYGKDELRTLNYTENDIKELSQVLLRSGYRRENVVVMTQSTGAYDTDLLPTAANIRTQLKLLLQDRTEAHSVLIAFAGHGVQFQNDQATYFCPAGAKLDDKGTLVSLSEVSQQLEQCEAHFKIMLVDACRNDPLSESGARRATMNLPSMTRPRKPVPAGGVATFFSCSAGEVAFENSDLQHGVFFNYVIRGLQGEADMNKDGQVTLFELADYVQLHVSDFVRSEYKKRQMPELVNKTNVSTPLVVLPRERAQPPQPPQAPPASQYRLRDLTLILETAIVWEAVSPEWQARRDGWVRDVQRADSVPALRRLVAELESNILWTAVAPSWRDRRDGWVRDCARATNAADLGKLLVELESYITWDAVSAKWKDLREPWVIEARKSNSP
jgi:uncharacterized caspase-like protein